MSSFLENLSKSLTTIRYQETESINCAFDKFENTFKEVLAMFAPYRRSSGNTIRKPNWFDKNLKNLICKKNQSHKSWKMDRQNNTKVEKFKALRIKVEKTIKAKKKFYYEQKFSKCIGDSKQVYNLLNELKGVTVKNSKVPCLITDGRRIDDNLDVANELNTFFVGIGQKTKEGIPNEAFVRPQVNNLQSMWLYETNCIEIPQIIEDLKEKPSAGIDDISMILIKKTRSLTCKHLVHLVNKSFKDRKFPSILKQA